jgi:hypothetical protein
VPFEPVAAEGSSGNSCFTLSVNASIIAQICSVTYV